MEHVSSSTNVSSYQEFLMQKTAGVESTNRPVSTGEVNDYLHGWQREIVAWASTRGRAAIWADTGLGKTMMQLEFARITAGNGRALIVAPLAVCQQTCREAEKLGITATYLRNPDPDVAGIWVTNYEMVDHFSAEDLTTVVLDEASILKQSDGKTRTRLIAQFADVPFRLACTATPAPNDPEELTNQAEFLGRSTRVNMLAAYFIHDSDGWRLKGHAKSPMFQWMSSWAVAIRRPSDMGYDDGAYLLPDLNIIPHLVDVDIEQEGQLFATDLGGVGGRAKVRRETLQDRCEAAAAIVTAEPNEPWLIWCGLNAEAEMMADLLPDAVNVHGGWTPEDKADALLGFADGTIRTLITKPSLAAFGLNWQHCARMVFVGLSDSYEAYYQAIRRCWRYGQLRPVDAHIVLSALESQIAANVRKKETTAAMLSQQMVAAMKEGKTNDDQ